MLILRPRKTDQELYDSTCQWHQWQAWYPVISNDGLVWLETVERRRILIGGFETFFAWEYRRLGVI